MLSQEHRERLNGLCHDQWFKIEHPERYFAMQAVRVELARLEVEDAQQKHDIAALELKLKEPCMNCGEKPC